MVTKYDSPFKTITIGERNEMSFLPFVVINNTCLVFLTIHTPIRLNCVEMEMKFYLKETKKKVDNLESYRKLTPVQLRQTEQK